MADRVAALRREVERGIRAGGKRRADPWLQKYVGSPVPVLGLGTAEMRAILNGFAKAHRDLDARTVHALAGPRWRGHVAEERWAGIGILERYSAVWNEASWRMADRWVDDAVGWGLCDSLGAGPIADMGDARPAPFRGPLRGAR